MTINNDCHSNCHPSPRLVAKFKVSNQVTTL